MGYETKLIIGVVGHTAPELKQHKNLRLDSDKQSAYRPLSMKNGKAVMTKNNATYFMVYATIDLGKCGFDSHISKIDHVNQDKSNYLYFYGDGGNQQIKEDLYGSYLKAIPIQEVIDALRKDVKKDDYSRFKWALALLESMTLGGENICVLMYGH